MKQHRETAARLRTAARKLFADKGFNAASVREITRLAGANLGAVTYHFGSKEALHHAVLEDVFEDAAQRVEQAAAQHPDPAQRIRAVVTAFFAFFAAAPDAPLLLIREVAGGAPPPAPVVPRIRRILGAITRVIVDGQQHGVFRAVPPHLAAFSLVSQCVWFAVVGRHMPGMLDLEIPDTILRATMREHIADVVTRAVITEPPHA